MIQVKNPIKSRRAGVVTLVAVLIVLALGTAALVNLGAVAYRNGANAAYADADAADTSTHAAALCVADPSLDYWYCRDFRAEVAADAKQIETDATTTPTQP